MSPAALGAGARARRAALVVTRRDGKVRGLGFGSARTHGLANLDLRLSQGSFVRRRFLRYPSGTRKDPSKPGCDASDKGA